MEARFLHANGHDPENERRGKAEDAHRDVHRRGAHKVGARARRPCHLRDGEHLGGKAADAQHGAQHGGNGQQPFHRGVVQRARLLEHQHDEGGAAEQREAEHLQRRGERRPRRLGHRQVGEPRRAREQRGERAHDTEQRPAPPTLCVLPEVDAE
ncbi:hypothetical protein, partial [Gordonibacter pamelaeae]|uniref:hypothetical protein n=1 Tax=Gordonibacter pamelaeae TaxID=471189 RepID=UPI001E366D44